MSRKRCSGCRRKGTEALGDKALSDPGQPAREPAPAKINLALHVRGRMADGYHALDTLFAFTDFGDTVTASPAPDWRLTLSGPMAADLDTTDDNLVLRAARLFADATGSRPWHLALEKRLPVASGIGGGSADAAATLRLLNRLAGRPLAPDALLALAATLGADVPACLAARSMYGAGRGADLRPGPNLAGTPILLVNPRVAVPTAAVFRRWDGVDRGPLRDWKTGRNDLTAAATALAPEIGTVLAWLCRQPGVTLARMSGSGATCFALYEGLAPIVPAAWWSVATTLR